MLRLRPAFAGTEVTFASVGASRAADVAPAPYHPIPDANRAQKLKLLWLLWLTWLVRACGPTLSSRPGRRRAISPCASAACWVRARLFLDSIANAEELSLSANLARRHCDLVLTQWPHLAEGDSPGYRGSVL
jgi:hypothetical protein